MENEGINLVITLPHKKLPPQAVDKVVVPAVEGNLTVLRDRAPTTVLLANGILDILDEHNASVKKYFVKGGVANIAINECVITTEKIIDLEEVNTARIQVLKHEHQKELDALCANLPNCQGSKTDSDIDFYQYIFKYLEANPDLNQ